MSKPIALSSPELAFNARWLTETEVAETFVPPHHFSRVARRGHTLIVGPRGSGKTTLLKMLQPAALSAWATKSAGEIRNLVDYCGAFVPADISWSQQVSAALDPGTAQRVMQAAFTTSALRALVETAEWRVLEVDDVGTQRFLGVHLERSREVALVREVDNAWGLNLETPSLLGLRHSLRRALLSLRSSVDSAIAKDPGGSQIGHPLSSIDLLQAAALFVEIFNDAVAEGHRRWALLFDELEIAPAWIQKYLFEALRSADSRLLLKLALSPFNNNISIGEAGTAPAAGQDYEQVALWFAQRRPAERAHEQLPFCVAIWDTTLRRLRLPNTSAFEALGDSASTDDDPVAEQGESGRRGRARRRDVYALTGKRGRAFKQLYDIDSTFRSYMSARDVTPQSINRMREEEKARVIRKVAPIVAVRAFYRGPSQSDGNVQSVARSRKGIDLYTGAEAFFAISEGHPRWLKMVLARILEDASDSGQLRIRRDRQGAAMLAAAHRFNALLSTLSSGLPATQSKFRSVHQLVKTVAEYFHSEVVKAPFRAEPPLSFIVDANISDEFLLALQLAVNIGAFVYMPDGEGEIVLRSLRGRRFRVSYWLAPIYGLPLVSGRAVSLSSILFEGARGDDLFTEIARSD